MKEKLSRLQTNNSKLEKQIGWLQQVAEESEDSFGSQTVDGISEDMEQTLEEYKRILTDMEEELE